MRLSAQYKGFKDNYILLSEIAVDIRFRNRKFGSLLMKEFETNATNMNIRVLKLVRKKKQLDFIPGYLPSLFAQVKEKYEKSFEH